MSGPHGAVLGGDRSPLDQGKQVALHAFARNIGTDAPLAAGDLVDLVEKNDAVLLDRMNGFRYELVVVEQLVGFLVEQNVMGFRNRDATRFGSAAAELAENIADRDGAHL